MCARRPHGTRAPFTSSGCGRVARRATANPPSIPRRLCPPFLAYRRCSCTGRASGRWRLAKRTKRRSDDAVTGGPPNRFPCACAVVQSGGGSPAAHPPALCPTRCWRHGTAAHCCTGRRGRGGGVRRPHPSPWRSRKRTAAAAATAAGPRTSPAAVGVAAAAATAVRVTGAGARPQRPPPPTFPSSRRRTERVGISNRTAATLIHPQTAAMHPPRGRRVAPRRPKRRRPLSAPLPLAISRCPSSPAVAAARPPDHFHRQPPRSRATGRVRFQ